MSKTLIDYIELLRSPQQDYIVFCVQQHSGREDFHRGLLPFLPAEEAARCLQVQLENMKGAQNVNDADLQGRSLLGEKFIRQIISVFRGALIYRLSEDEESNVIWLSTAKLKRGYGRRFEKKFHITLAELGVQRKSHIEGMFELQMVSRNKWKVTGHKDYLASVCSHLADEYGLPISGV